MKKSNNEFLHRWKDDLRRAINALQHCGRSLRSKFAKLFLKGGKTFDHFCVTLHRGGEFPEKLTGQQIFLPARNLSLQYMVENYLV